MNFKKLAALLLLSVLIFAGCTQSDTPDTTTETETTETETTEAETTDETEETADSDVLTELTENVEITFWHGMSGGQEETLTELTNKFMEENENITVSLQNQGNYGDLSQNL